MPKIADHLEIHHLYSVAQRKKDFPEADWGFLLHTASNCAIAFEAVHSHGHVVGDVNQKNVMVSRKGIVAFVDCDSFQVAEGSRIFRCGVGVPEYTPPELHGKNFATLDRSANHDLFGLAVLVFHLLMMGRHPFSGVPLTQADIPIEKAIQDGSYAYTRNTTTARLKPPPHVPPAAMLDPAVLDLFERAFCTTRRPTATEWLASLDAAMKRLLRCKNDPKHAYLAAAGKLPVVRAHRSGEVDVLPAFSGVWHGCSQARGHRAADHEAVWDHSQPRRLCTTAAQIAGRRLATRRAADCEEAGARAVPGAPAINSETRAHAAAAGSAVDAEAFAVLVAPAAEGRREAGAGAASSRAAHSPAAEARAATRRTGPPRSTATRTAG